jgi:2,3-bisphosphoglycerate-dependent phosphoglycerate mutase
MMKGFMRDGMTLHSRKQVANKLRYEPFYGVGESDWEIHCRAIRATERIIRRGAGCYLIVSHGGILNAALRGIVGAHPPINGQHGIWFALGDTGYVKTVYTPAKHQWLIEELIPE